jgi:SAM-dependent methyltransferase
MLFKDRFSGHASEYAQFRPRYPVALFDYLAGVAPDRLLAWDCATGNGQAALGLAEFFRRVIATDASEKQIANANHHERIQYRIATSEKSGLEARSASLVTVAQALHWFDVDLFFKEAIRVLKPGGVLAIWCYNLVEVSPAIDALLEKFYRETVGPFWNFERRLVETGYRTIAYPFVELQSPTFQMTAHWSLDHLLGYLRTWSATQGFVAARGFDPVISLGAKLAQLWGAPADKKGVSWPLSVRVGRSEV